MTGATRTVLYVVAVVVPSVMSAGACGGKVAVDPAGMGGTSSSSTSSSSSAATGGAGGAVACTDVRTLCDDYCKSWLALGCGANDDGCQSRCLGALFLGSPEACRPAVVAAVQCAGAHGLDDCDGNFPAACTAEQAALSACWDLGGPCNGYDCGACGCAVSGCETSFETECYGVEDGVACDCKRDGQVLDTCIEGGACPGSFPGCCADAFFPSCAE